MTVSARNILIFYTLILSACDQATDYTPAVEDAQTISIAHLKSFCHEDTHRITREVSIRGRIISSDRFGEFGTTMVIEDASGGISLSVSDRTIADEYPFGASVQLYCNGLMLRNIGGKICLGLEPDSEGHDLIPSDRLHLYLERLNNEEQLPRPRTLRFTDLTPRDMDTYIGFEDVAFTERGTWCAFDAEEQRFSTTEHPIVNAQGDSLMVRTLWSCSYANEPLPEGRGSLWGVVDYFNHRYALQVVNFSKSFD